MGGPAGHGLSLMDVYRARSRIRELTVRTPLLPSLALSRKFDAPVYLKLENQQFTGSFKVRGALNAALSLAAEKRRRGVVTVSTGNHGRAVAHACHMLGVPVTVCMSRRVPANKVSAIEELGARIRISGDSQDDAQLEADRLVTDEGLALIPPFDHADVIAGQGTIGLEIAEQLLEAHSAPRSGATPGDPGGSPGEPDDLPLQVVVPLSGGGLISGVALALKALEPDVRVVGVSMERGCAMYQCQKAGRYLPVEEQESLADSLGGGIGAENRYTFEMVGSLVDEMVLVGEEEIAAAIVHAYLEERQIVEGAAAVGIAALLAGSTEAAGHRTVVLVSGANIDIDVHRRLVNGETSPKPELTAEGGD